MLKAKVIRTSPPIQVGEMYEVDKIEPSKGSFSRVTLKGVKGTFRSSDLEFYQGNERYNIYLNPNNRIEEVVERKSGADFIKKLIK